VPYSRLVHDNMPQIAMPGWLSSTLSDDIFATDIDGNAYGELDYSDAAHKPRLLRFYDRTLAFIQEVLGDRVFGLVTGINSELEIKYGQTQYRWRSYSRQASLAFDEWLAANGSEPGALPGVEFNNALSDFVPKIVPRFAEMMKFREEEIVRYITPLCDRIHAHGYKAIGYFGQFFTYHDAIYASGVVEACAEQFDIVSFDYNYYNGYEEVRNPWIVPAMVSFGRSAGYRQITLGLYVERFRNFQTNQLDVSILETLKDTLDCTDDGDDFVSIEIGGVETGDLPALRSSGLIASSGRPFEVAAALPTPEPDAIRVAIVASFDTHYLWHGDFSSGRDCLSDVLTDTFRILRRSSAFAPRVVSARDLAAGRYGAADFDLLFFPHTLVMSEELIARLTVLAADGLPIAQDIGCGTFTPNGEVRELSALPFLGLGGAEWFTQPGRFVYDGAEIEVGEPGRSYFTYVRLAPGAGGQIWMPEVGAEGAGLIAVTGSALTFGFLPQIAGNGRGPSFWETLFVNSLRDFVQSRGAGRAAA
jgi:beta-galactosidase